jgi:hypothetical protein
MLLSDGFNKDNRYIFWWEIYVRIKVLDLDNI